MKSIVRLLTLFTIFISLNSYASVLFMSIAQVLVSASAADSSVPSPATVLQRQSGPINITVEELLFLSSFNDLDDKSSDCQVQTSGNPTVQLTVDDDCHFANFIRYIVTNECNKGENRQLRISNSIIYTELDMAKQDCSRLNTGNNIELEKERQASTSGVLSTPKAFTKILDEESKQRYVIQFYVGKTPPISENLGCKTDRTFLNRINNQYYLFSPKLSLNQAKQTLTQLKQECSTQAWIRSLNMGFVQ
ncbi:hypothetical protein N9R79_08815 [Vibrio sp.]|nr:hypothetical protein [Vibrio sp.]